MHRNCFQGYIRGKFLPTANPPLQIEVSMCRELTVWPSVRGRSPCPALAARIGGLGSIGMQKRFFGDSYDVVKRHWRELLSPIAPLFADPRFVQRDIRNAYTRLTGISIWPDRMLEVYALLIDRDAGIPLPGAVNQGMRPSHCLDGRAIAFLPTYRLVSHRDRFNIGNLGYLTPIEPTPA